MCLRPVTFNDIVRQLQLSEEQQQQMLAVRKTWRDFLAGYDAKLPSMHINEIFVADQHG